MMESIKIKQESNVYDVPDEDLYIMKSIQIKEESNVSDIPENNIYIYEGCEFKPESHTSSNADGPTHNYCSQNAFNNVNGSIIIKREDIDEITSDSFNDFDKNIINTLNINVMKNETILNENALMCTETTSSQNITSNKSTIKTPTTISKLALLDRVKTNADLTKLCSAKVILKRINVKDYLKNKNTERIKNLEESNNIKNTESDLTNTPKLSFINKKSNNHFKIVIKKEKKIKTKYNENIDFTSLIMINCQKCNRTYESIEKIKQCQDCKTNLTYICQTCNLPCRTYIGALRHVKFTCKGTDYYYYCNDCSYKNRYKATVKKHVLEKHLEETLPRHKCNRCSLTFKRKYHLTRHQNTCGLPPHLFCTFCSYKFSRKDNLIKHIETFHIDKINSDEELNNIIKTIVEKGQAIKQIDDSNKAVVGLEKTSPYSCVENFVNHYCTKCEKTYSTKELNKTRTCPKCKTSFLFECIKCRKICKHYKNIYGHIVFTCCPRYIFKCDYCSFETTVKLRLSNHIKYKHLPIDLKDYKNCSKCDKKFKVLSSLKRHEKHCKSESHVK